MARNSCYVLDTGQVNANGEQLVAVICELCDEQIIPGISESKYPWAAGAVIKHWDEKHPT